MATTPSYPETNLIKKADLARAREIDFTLSFTGSLKKLLEALGVTRKIAKTAGAELKTYKAVGSLAEGDGAVAEGDLIPLSKYTTTAVTYEPIALRKWRKATSAEAIIEKGYDQAVIMTTDKMEKDVQKSIRTNFFNFLSTKASGSKSGAGLQGAIAQAWGQLQVLFEDETIESVYFVNPEDIADYLEKATISTQTAFGMRYVEDFLGMGTVILNTGVTKGTVYATAKDNIILYYIPVNGADLGEVFSFTSDETGLIGIHEAPNYTNMTAEDVIVSGLTLFPEYEDGLVKTTIASPAVSPEA